MDNKEKITVLIPCLNEESYITKCIKSIIKSDYPKEKMEVFFIDGGSNDNTMPIIQKYKRQYSYIHLLHNPHKYVPFALNLGITQAKGDIIIRLDAHAEYPANYFSLLVHNLLSLDAENVGGIWKTDVINHSFKTNSIVSVLTDPIGVGNALFRTGIESITEVDTVPFGCFRKSIFNKIGGFNNSLIRNQDIEFNKRIKKYGGRIFLIPNIQSTYYARETFYKIWKNNFANGKWNLLTVYYTKDIKSLSTRHFIPLSYLLSLVIPIMFIPFHYGFLWLSIFSFTAYNALIIVRSFMLLHKRSNSLIYLILSFFTLHYSYALGSFCGLLRILFLTTFAKKH